MEEVGRGEKRWEEGRRGGKRGEEVGEVGRGEKRWEEVGRGEKRDPAIVHSAHMLH